MEEWRTRHVKKVVTEGDVGVERQKEKEEDKLATLFYGVHEFLTDDDGFTNFLCSMFPGDNAIMSFLSTVSV